MTTDTSERGLERLICTALTGQPCDTTQEGVVRERPSNYGSGWVCGDPQDYDREYCVDLAQLSAFLCTTQTKAAESLDLGQDSPTRRKFLARLQGEISKRGVIDVLRKGVKDGPHHVELFYGTPSPGNPAAAERYAQNRFSVTRQLRYSRDETQRALDLGLFINGLPVFTFELKNSLTKQTVEDAVEQYKRDRAPREKLFEFGRSVAHFAVDDHEVRFCTHLKGKTSTPVASRAVEGLWFLERPPADEPILLVGSAGELVWAPAPQLLFFRTDAVATLPARVLRSTWAVLALPGDAVALLLLEDEAAVEKPSPDITLGPGVWLGVRATQREESPDWLTASSIDDLLRGSDSMLTTWAELARRILVEKLAPPP